MTKFGFIALFLPLLISLADATSPFVKKKNDTVTIDPSNPTRVNAISKALNSPNPAGKDRGSSRLKRRSTHSTRDDIIVDPTKRQGMAQATHTSGPSKQSTREASHFVRRSGIGLPTPGGAGKGKGGKSGGKTDSTPACGTGGTKWDLGWRCGGTGIPRANRLF